MFILCRFHHCVSRKRVRLSLETLNNLCKIGWPIPDWFVYNAIDDARECCSFFNDVVFLYIVIYLLVLNVLKLQIHQRIILLILVNGSDAFLSCSVKKKKCFT